MKNTSPHSVVQKNTADKKGNVPLFPVVAIGASAGGLEAITRLLKNLPVNLGAVYVIIQHLSPNHKSLLPELLERTTTMKVHTVTDGLKIEPDNVYVIPPNAYMSIVDGHLTLTPRKDVMGVFHSIDFFLKALSVVYQNNAIAVILSGTATDGTYGIQAIKEEGGITFAQDDSAIFQGMPSNAANSGFIDFIMSPENMAKELTALMKLPFLGVTEKNDFADDASQVSNIFFLLDSKYMVDFSQYKQTTINRRIWRRMAINKITKLPEYVNLVKEDPKELHALYNDLLINVTSFFREPDLELLFKQKIFPAITQAKVKAEPIRIWIPACSTGEEACTIAIYLFEYFGDVAMSTPVQIFATDLSEKSIEKARTGIYNKNGVAQISPDRLKRFFIEIDGGYQIIKPIRDICVYATHNLMVDPPFSRMDIISCQNVMIYLEAKAQKNILQSFHYSLRNFGFLILGKSETVSNSLDLFELDDKQNKIYIKKETTANSQYHFPSRQPSGLAIVKPSEQKSNIPDNEIDIDKETDKLLLSKYVQPSVVVNKDMHIFRFHGAVSVFLQPVSGKASLHLLKMVRDELVFEIRSLVHKVKKTGISAKKEGISLTDNGQTRQIGLEVVPVKSSLKEPYFLILFLDQKTTFTGLTPAPLPIRVSRDTLKIRIQTLEDELKEAREQMKTTSEEFEATREELQSSNEEVLSSNEELQSINEELETSKEELQSANEELTTINEELQLRNSDLKEAVEYTKAIVETIREPIIVLNSDMRIRTANKTFYKTFSLHPEQTEGSYFFEMKDGLWNIPELRSRLTEIISKNKTFQDFELVHTFPGNDKKVLYFNAVRMDESGKNRYLLAIEDVTLQKNAELELKDALHSNSVILNSISDTFVAVDNNWKIIFANEQAKTWLQSTGEVLQQVLWTLLKANMQTTLFTNLHEAMDQKAFRGFEYYTEALKQWHHFRIYPSPEGLSIYASDITQQKFIEQHIRENLEVFQLLVQNSFDIIAIYDEQGVIKYCSDSVEQVLGYTCNERVGKSITDDPVIHPNDIEIEEDLFKKSKDTPGSPVTAEFRLLHKDGTYKIMECVFANLLGDMRVKGIVANYRDITERKILEKQKEEFISVASHELKTPVTGIKLYASMLEELTAANSNDKQVMEFAQKLNLQVDKFIHLIKDLLDFTRINEGQLKLNLAEYDINDLIKEAVDELQLISLNHHLVVELQPVQKLLLDKNRINQVLINLISNAIKYSPEADTVYIRSQPTETGIQVLVEDFGIGIPEGTQQKIFERFFRVSHATRNHVSGLGLGLYISSEIVKRHGGKIAVDYKKEKGCIFKFELPFIS